MRVGLLILTSRYGTFVLYFFTGNDSKDNENDNDNVMTTTVKTEVFHAYSGEIVMIVKWPLFPMYLITRCL